MAKYIYICIAMTDSQQCYESGHILKTGSG